MDTKRYSELRDKIVESCSGVIVGKEDKIELVLISFICRGHVLLEDLPGTGKTMLLRAFAKTLGCGFGRIQFTPDLLPSDLTGINFYSQKSGDFEFRRGPVFTNIVLADEINRATPRTQSALLEAMEERQVTVDGTSYPLAEPFMVMATQNPIESYGTFPLPEAQIDRFLMRLSLGYMTREQELSVICRRSTLDLLAKITPVVTAEDIEFLRTEYMNTTVSEDVAGYIMDIIEATRRESAFQAGVSTRGAIALYKAAQAKAAISGRDYVIPEDVKAVAHAVLGHRLTGGGSYRPADLARRLDSIIEGVEAPLENE